MPDGRRRHLSLALSWTLVAALGGCVDAQSQAGTSRPEWMDASFIEAAPDAGHRGEAEPIPDFCADANRRSVASGHWSDPESWAGGVPGAGDGAIVSSGTELVYDVSTAPPLSCIKIEQDATLRFSTDRHTRLEVGTLLVVGALTVGSVEQPVDAAHRAEVVILDVPIERGVDPLSHGTGILVVGKLSIHGAQKAPTWVRLAREPRAGDRTIQLETPVHGWQVGDRAMIPDSRQLSRRQWKELYGTSVYEPKENVVRSLLHDEVVNISSIDPDGTTLELSTPIAHDHPGARDVHGKLRFLPHLGNLDRNVVVRSQNPEGTRGHIMVTHRAEVDVRYAQFKDLGRTSVAPLGEANQIGRYSFHFHHVFGPEESDKEFQAVYVGNANWGAPKFCVTIHDTHYGLFKQNVAYECAGSAFMIEQGQESFNVLEENFAAVSIGTGLRIGARDNHQPEDLGHEGSCIWIRSPYNTIRNNVCANGRRNGFAGIFGGVTMQPKGPGSDTSIPGQAKRVARGGHFANGDKTPAELERKFPQAQSFLEFSDNEAYGTPIGFDFWRLQPGVETLLTRPRGWHLYREGIHLQYTPLARVDNPILINDRRLMSSDYATAGVDLAVGYDHDTTLVDVEIHNFDFGYMPSRRKSEIHGGVMANLVNLAIGTCSNGTGCGQWPNAIEARGVEFLLPESGSDKPLLAWVTLQRLDSDSLGVVDAPFTVHVRDARVNGQPVPDYQLFFDDQLTRAVGGVRARCGDRVEYIRGIACPMP